MKRKQFTCILSGAMIALLTGLTIMIGCESSGTDSSSAANFFDNSPFTGPGRDAPGLRITPTSVQISGVGEEIVFTAQDGTPPYDWRLGLNANGHIRQTANNQAVYDVQRLANNTILVRDSKGRTGQAQIVGSVAFEIVPATATIRGNGGTIQFSLKGGVPPYEVVLTAPGIGTLTAGNLYTRTSDGTQVITVLDANRNATSATISQPEEALVLTVQPSNATLGTNDLFATVSVQGGTAPYSWSTGSGTVAPISGPSTVYTRPNATFDGNDFVTVGDSGGLTASVSLTLDQN